ncbi:MAG TPA: DUF711 family protein [Candidatus Acidoferrales bacterium]|nr:DUF711 family protein [Candidatus Acidoferrales bacterium]
MFRHSGSTVNVLPFLWQALFLAAFLLAAVVAPADAQGKPKVRTITAFIRLDAAQYQQQISDTLKMLRNARSRFGLAGYEVQTIRITTQPFPEYTKGMSKEAALGFFRDLESLAKKEDVSISIGPALMTEKDDPAQAELLREILGSASHLYGSIIVAGSDGVHVKALHEAAETIKYLADQSDKGLGNFRFAAIANVPAYTPFYPASYHQGFGHQFAIALESANVVAAAMAVQRDTEATRQVLISELGRHAQAVQDIGSKIDQETGWSYMGIDLSPAPMKYTSIGSAIAGFTGGRFGSSGTLTAVATITSALRDIVVTKVGYTGVMMPVLEDTRLAQLWGEGALTIDQLLGYSAVCGTGLDTIPLPGDVSTQQLERIIGDVATLSVKLTKPLSARLLPVAGAKAGDQTTFDDPNLVNTVIQALP